MTPPLPALPPFLPKPGAVIPFALQRFLLEPMIQRQFMASMTNGDLAFLRGRYVQIVVMDAGFSWTLTLGRDGPVMIQGAIQPDIEIRGNLESFMMLAMQQQDPDTLFFRRQLTITGDTDMALTVKNLLYGIEWLPEVGMLANRLQSLLHRTGLADF